MYIRSRKLLGGRASVPRNFEGSRGLSPAGSGIKIAEAGGLSFQLREDDVNLSPGIFVSARGNPCQALPPLSPLVLRSLHLCVAAVVEHTKATVDCVSPGKGVPRENF